MAITEKMIRDDRDAVIAFRSVSPPTFDGNEPQLFDEWSSTINSLFIALNVSERIHLELASTQLKGYALRWWNWIRKHRFPKTWAEMAYHLERKFAPKGRAKEKREEYSRRFQSWQRYPSESFESYIKRFKEELLSMAPADEIPEDLNWIFWKHLPPFAKAVVQLQQGGTTEAFVDFTKRVVESLEALLDIEDNYRDYTLPRNAEDEDDMNSEDFNEDPSEPGSSP